MPSNKRKTETIDILAGGSNKKGKIQLKDPFADRYGEVIVEVYNISIPDFVNKIFEWKEDYEPPKFEIKSYKSECAGVAKTVCGETRFIEDLRATFVLTYELGKKDEIVKILTLRFPTCTYTFK